MIAGIADEGIAAHDGGAAVDDVRNRFPVAGQDSLIKQFPVCRPAGSKNLRDAGHGGLEIGKQLIEGFGQFLKAFIGQMSIEDGLWMFQ